MTHLKPPKTNSNNGKFFVMFEQFYKKISFRGWQPAKDDEKLAHLFRLKVNLIAEKMVLSGEIFQLPMGLRLYNLSQRKVCCSASGKRTTPPSTPPATLVLPQDKLLDGLELWNWSDADVRAQLFRKQLRSAKDAQRLYFEWEDYCAKISRQGASDGESSPRSRTDEISARTCSLQNCTASSEEACLEEDLGRSITRTQAETGDGEAPKENEPKRIKTDPA